MTDITVNHSAEQIMKEIRRYITSDVTVIDALAFYAEKHDMEIELLGDLIRRSPTLKAFVREDAERLRLVEEDDGPKLPI